MTETPAPEAVWTAEKLAQASFKDLGTPAEVKERFYNHLMNKCRQPLLNLLHESSSTTRDYSITVDTFDLLQADPILGQLLLKFPATLLPVLVDAVVQGQAELLREQDEEEQAQLSVKGEKTQKGAASTRVHARLVNLPPGSCKTSLASMQASDVGKILQVSGTVVRTNPVQMYESTRTYKCTGKKGCGRNFVVHADLEQRENSLVPPQQCPLTLDSSEDRCHGTNFSVVDGGSIHTDYQEIKIQEAASSLEIGHIPRSLFIKLQHDLVDSCQPGDVVVVVGSLLAQWQTTTPIPDVECSVGVAMSAHSVRIVSEKTTWQGEGTNAVGQMDQYRKEFVAYWDLESSKSKPFAARDFISKAVCPTLYGMKVIKMALLMTLIGGVSAEAYKEKDHNSQTDENVEPIEDEGPVPFQIFTDSSNQNDISTATYDGHSESPYASSKKKKRNQAVKTRRRDQSHLLLVGDPGTGKSQFLRFAAALCPRSVLTTGVGTTSAGLTCAAVREGNGKEFALEAGALVLADKGVCCIDEFGCIQDKDRTTIHEAMEQQTLSVAKAGIVCKLNCRATIVAVMNPKNCLYDNHASLATNTGLGTPLLSRFDLIFRLMDTCDAERDSNVVTYLLNRAIVGDGLEVADPAQVEGTTPWNMEKLRAYISIVKERFQPVITDAAATLLERHYEKCRSAHSNTIPVTVRFLESLIRLSQAHAKLMFRSTVTLEDAVATIEIMESTAFAYGGFDGRVDDFHNAMYCDPMAVDFEEDPDLSFLGYEYQLLERYNMLDSLDPDRRQRGQQLFAQPGNDVGDDQGWGELGNPYPAASSQPHQPQVTQDHYGRYHFGPSPNKRSRH